MEDQPSENEGLLSFYKFKNQQQGIVCNEGKNQKPQLQNPYLRCRKFKVNPIYSDCSEDQSVTYQAQESLANPTNPFLEVEQDISPKEKTAVGIKRPKLRKELKLEQVQIQPEEWKYIGLSEVPCQSLQFMREAKSQLFQQISMNLCRMVNHQTNKQILTIKGFPKVGKKTFVFDVIQGLRKRVDSDIQSFYMKFDGNQNSLKLKVFKLYKYLKEASQEQMKSFNNIFVIDNFHMFSHALKKNGLAHNFKALYLKTNFCFVFVDSQVQVSKDSFLSEKTNIIQFGQNSPGLITSLLMLTINNLRFSDLQWSFPKPLANFFCSKLAEYSKLNLTLITNMKTFLNKQSKRLSTLHQSDQTLQKQLVTRNLLEKFKEEFVDETRSVRLQDLALHSKLILVAAYTCLSRSQELTIRISELYDVYSWVCKSLSMSQRKLKEINEQTLPELEAYQLIFFVSRASKGKVERQICLKMDIKDIKSSMSKEALLLKFWENET